MNLTEEEHIYDLRDEAKKILENRFTDDEFRMGVNAGKASANDEFGGIPNSELFSGEIYVGKSKIKPQRWKAFAKKTVMPRRGGALTKRYDYIFIIGYQMEYHNIFFEIWYDSDVGAYFIADKYGGMVTHDVHHLKEAVDMLVGIIARSDPNFSASKRDKDKEEDILLRQGRKNQRRQADDDPLSAGVEIDVNKMLNESVATRELLTQMISQEIVQYHETRMNRQKGREFWKVFGRNPTYPSKYMKNGAVQKITGKQREATFIIGFSLAEKIDIEIWYVKEIGETGGSFYVFDITSGTIISEGIRTLRQAYMIVGKKIALQHVDT